MSTWQRMKSLITLASALAVAACCAGITGALADPWKFGVMSDTQWKIGKPSASCPLGDDKNCDGKSPNSVAVGIINELNQQFINQGVKFVVAVGDVTDNGSNLALDTRATFAQPLYNAGIGFYPLRGNHESSKGGALEFQRVFPQTQGGLNNLTPLNAFVSTPFYPVPPAIVGAPFVAGSNFASYSDDYKGLFYSFDYDNARFVLIDQFTPTSGAPHSVVDAPQVDWVGSQLAGRPAETHAFVFAHKGLITENHEDILFGSNPAANPALQNAFIANLSSGGVRYFFGGHDHMHNRAIVLSPDGKSSVQDITAASDSYKFYIPQVPSNDEEYNNPAHGIDGPRETELAQELFTIGYYIVTVDGPRVTVEYWAAPNGCNGDCDLTSVPTDLVFTKRESFGYSLNGRQFVIAQGDSYGVVQDSFGGITARILDGANSSTATDYAFRKLSKEVNTGWTPASNVQQPNAASHVLTLWGMADVGSNATDVFALSLRVEGHRGMPAQIGPDTMGLATRNEDGNWINAVDRNVGGTKLFVSGPYEAGYGLGTYGYDAKTQTAWAVINYNADFAVAEFAR